MKPLVTNRRVMTWLCLHPGEEGTIEWKKTLRIVNFVVTIATLVANIWSGSTYVYQNISTELKNCLFELTFIILFIDLLYTVVIVFLATQKTKTMFEDLETIYEANANEESFRFLEEANNQSEWMWSIYFKIIAICISSTVLFPLSMLFCWMSENFNTRCFYHTAYLVFPWSSESIPGYIGEVGFVILYCIVYLFSNGAILLLFISMCLHHQAFYKMFRFSANQLNDRDENRNDEAHLKRMIRFHTSVQKWFKDSAQLLSPFMLVHLTSSVIFIAAAVFQLDLQVQQIDMRIHTVLIVTSVAISNLFIYCYFGKLATDSFDRMADCLYEMNWHRLPVKLQKYLILMIANMQRPLHYHGSGIAVLDLDTFSKVMNTVYSYYMMFKTITTE